MLITLREHEYLPVLEDWVGNPAFGSFVSTLGETLSRGDHAVSTTPRLLEKFSRWSGLSDDQRTVLQTTARSLVTPPLAFQDVTDSLLLHGPAHDPLLPSDLVRWHRRDWTWLQQRGRLERTVLGAENLDDAKWFEWLARAWASRLRSRVPATAHEHRSPTAAGEPSLRCRGLGGNTAQQEVPHEAADGDPVLCILDSDRNHPNAELGGTARGLAKALKAAPSVERMLHVEHLRARDVENILPLELVRTAGRGSPWLEPMEKRGFFARPTVDVELSYIDLGKDQCERRLLATEDKKTKNYRTRALARIRQLDHSCTPSAQTCEGERTVAPDCLGKGAGPLPTSCIIVHSVGKPLRRILEAIDAEDRAPQPARSHPSTAAWLAAMLPPDDPAVLTPARLAWSWGLCSRPRIRGAQ
ncbi:hypothetical protein [Paraliomyxa miuraensis]|uniref:hypothetical protein n=1 Tax=Paraliomyxa miuraensis TaxID=376150 RepID=UPI002254B8A9|nr:hypothetical protein [Paraliomyxa miuraensis]MCX4243176.1 hypothetical protein [Paraliomyxa miuraensis]